MFNIGDEIFYPMHGAGVVTDIQEREILGNKISYYVAKMPGEVTVMLPVENAKSLGLRELISREEANNVMDTLLNDNYFSIENWTERYNENKIKIKNGDVFELAEIYKGLSYRNTKKNLSTTEKKMLLNTKQVLLSELSLVTGSSLEELQDRFENHFSTYLETELEAKENNK